MRLEIDEQNRRQLVAGGPWVFWRRGADGRNEDGLVLELFGCRQRECACREVRVRCHVVAPGLSSIDVSREGLVFSWRAPHCAPAAEDGPVIEASISFETGEVLLRESSQPVRGDETAILANLAREVDGEVLDRLYDEWLHAKAWHRRVTPTEGPWMSDPGLMVAWQEVFPDARQDIFVEGDSVTLVADNYCIAPRCSCKDVHMMFLEPAGGGKWKQFGDFIYDLGSGTVERLRPAFGANGKRVQAVWQAFQKRHDVSAHLSQRFARMKEVGSSIQASLPTPITRAPNEVARNAQCPCGSGKKYKKCCINAVNKDEQQRPTVA